MTYNSSLFYFMYSLFKNNFVNAESEFENAESDEVSAFQKFLNSLILNTGL